MQRPTWILSLFLGATLLASCDDTTGGGGGAKANLDPNLIGTWSNSATKSSFDTLTTVSFHANGTFHFVDSCRGAVTDSSTGTWFSISGSRFVATIDGITDTVAYSVSGSNLTVNLETFNKVQEASTPGSTNGGVPGDTPGDTPVIQKALVATWTTIEAETGETIQLTLRANGTLHITYTDEEGATDAAEGTWSASTSILAITIDGKSSAVSYSLEGKDLTISSDGSQQVWTKS